MEIGEDITLAVPARPRWVDTGVRLAAGETYLLTAAGTWRDWKITSGPEGYASPNVIMRLAERWRRLPGAPWFALVGSLEGTPDLVFHIGASTTYAPPETGTLRCFANDLTFAYSNNHGSVALTVTRIR